MRTININNIVEGIDPLETLLETLVDFELNSRNNGRQQDYKGYGAERGPREARRVALVGLGPRNIRFMMWFCGLWPCFFFVPYLTDLPTLVRPSKVFSAHSFLRTARTRLTD